MRNSGGKSDFYASLEEAKNEIWSRWRNLALRKKVADFIGSVPSPFQEAPKAVLDRNIATPNFEYFHFLKLAESASIAPLVTEYIGDKFVTLNFDKLGLGKMPFYKGRDKKKRILFECKSIIDCTKYQGKPFGEIKTFWGEHLVDFHHRLLPTRNGGFSFFDASAWYKSNGGNAERYYHNYLALFICNGILFENFITNEEEEERFSKSVVYPAFRQVSQHFGLKPLIVPLYSEDKATDIYWRCYSPEIKAIVSEKLKEGKCVSEGIEVNSE